MLLDCISTSCLQLPNPLLNVRYSTKLQLDILLLTVRKLAIVQHQHQTA